MKIVTGKKSYCFAVISGETIDEIHEPKFRKDLCRSDNKSLKRSNVHGEG